MKSRSLYERSPGHIVPGRAGQRVVSCVVDILGRLHDSLPAPQGRGQVHGQDGPSVS